MRSLSLPALAVIALLSSVARAEPEAPAPAPAQAPATAPLRGTAQAPATAPLPGTAPEPALAPPVEMVAPPAEPTSPTPTLTPEPVQAPPPLTLDRRTPQSPASRPVPFYQQDWFWGAVGVVILTTAVILVSAASSGTDTPITTLGNMRAF